MADMFHLKIITPDKQFYEGEADMAEFTTTEGEIGIYKDHIPLTTIIAPGVLTIHEESGQRKAALLSGFAVILPQSVTILAEAAEWPDEIDKHRAQEAKIRAERRLHESGGEFDVLRTEMALRRALVRLGL